MSAVEGSGAPRWAEFRAEQLREWFRQSPFYAGSPLASVRFSESDSLNYLRDATGRVCCTMSAAEMRRVVAP